jgi:hypothetical protein
VSVQRRHPSGRFAKPLPVGSSQPKPAKPTPMGRTQASGRPEVQRGKVTQRARQAKRS